MKRRETSGFACCFLLLSGVGCSSSDGGNTNQNDNAHCVDSDEDDHYAQDASQCPAGDDQCDGDPDNWTATGCASCVDGDGDGHGVDCDRGPDCNDSDPGIWTGCPGVAGVAIATGRVHSCAIKSDTTVWCWGDNSDGQLGDGTTNPSLVPVPVSGLTGIASVSAGECHTCAAGQNGSAWCWGTGPLGDATITQSALPVAVSGLTGVTAIAAAADHTCAVRQDGTAWCWGWNGEGQLGDGTTDPSPTPVQVSGLTDAALIAVAGVGGLEHSCAVKTDSTAWCWGSNLAGQLGDGTYNSSLTPVLVTGLTAATAIASGGMHAHACAVLDDGTAWCWGAGVLGNGTSGDSTFPAQATGITGAVQIEAGEWHTCAVSGTGDALCWGNNSQGQLGDGTTTESLVPIPVSGLVGVVAISAGGGWSAGVPANHTCALKGDGALWCWGSNDDGQLGDGTTSSSAIPVHVSGF